MRVVVVGASRGIGLEYCRQYIERGDEVVAICREVTAELKELGVAIHENVDVVDFKELKSAASEIGKKGIDILIHNAGIWRSETIDDLNFDTILEQFEVNSLGPLMSVQAFLPYLSDGSKIAVMSSRMGSITDNSSGGRYGYRMSKCALNMGLRSMSHDLKERGVSIAILHPGYVRTDMTDGRGEINPDESVRGLINRIEGLNIENSGTFWHSNGEVLPW